VNETINMFYEPKSLRKKARKLMHVVDAGISDFKGECHIALFKCPRCGYESQWMCVDTITEAKRGKPCPECNKERKNDESNK